MAYESDIDLIYLQKQLVEHFTLEELDQLCFDLRIDYEELPGDTKTTKARELVKFAYRQGRLPEIVQQCEKERPKVRWNRPATIYTRDNLPDEWVEPLQRYYRLAKAFNRNRSQPFSDVRTRQGDEIAFAMREAAPFLFDQFDVGQWLRSESSGKRLAAVKYLDWLQDIDFLSRLLGMLVTEKPFIQFHVLLTLDSMLDQLDSKHRGVVTAALSAYKVASRDPEREYWRRRILSKLVAQGSTARSSGT